MAIVVNVDNFVRAETDRMFAGQVARLGGVNRLHHEREPVRIEDQTVIRTNRDTLYSAAVVDISAGAILTLPDAGGRYQSAMIVNQDHYINRVFHGSGEYPLTTDEFDTPYVVAVVRTLVDPNDPDDVATVHRLQDGIGLTASSSEPYRAADYDSASLDRTRTSLLELGRGMTGYARSFGRRSDVDPIHHLIGTATGWGGLPEWEATYLNVDPGQGVGEYRLTVRDVPVDAFWSVTVYGNDGFFVPNERNRYSINSVTAARDPEGDVTVRFGPNPDGPNALPIADGWNYAVRLYRPRAEILDGTWTFPSAQPV